MQRNRGKTIEWERLEISPRKLEIPREHFMQMSTIKDRNGMDLTEAENIKKRWQGYTELKCASFQGAEIPGQGIQEEQRERMPN